MNLPENGKIVIIDDIFEEALPLMNALSRKGISFSYFDGVEIDNLPEKPVENVRMIFLDLELGTEGQDPKSKIAKVLAVLNKIVGNKNDPFIILVWTKYDVLIDDLKQGINNDFKPVFLNMDKQECKNENGKFRIDVIENKLKTELKKAGIFHLFILWENIVNQAAGTVVNEISRLQTYDENWNQNMQTIFYEMAKAYSGKKLNTNKFVIPSLMTFNDLFLDTLETMIKNYVFSIEFSLQEKDKKLEDKIKAEINSKLMLVTESDNTLIPGNVYKIKNYNKEMDAIINSALNRTLIYEAFCNKNNMPAIELFEKNGSVKKDFKKPLDNFYDELRINIAHKCKFIELEISPSCDYYQDKWIYSRLVKGILWNFEFAQFLNRADYLYISPMFHIKNENYRLVFDFRYLRGVSVKKQKYRKTKAIFRIRHELLVDIQSHLARHINRPGVLSLG